ncbi:MAG: sulfite exporter TauE/SafE family protein [Nanoarchaeota archaeon]
MVKKRFAVQGMTCSSCEVLIERKLYKVPGVEKVNVSRARGEVVVESSNDMGLGELQAALQGENYTLSEHNELISKRTSFKRYGEIGAAALFIGGLYLLFKQFNLIPESFGVTDNMGYGFVFILGLIAATSTCLAVSGGLLLAITQKYTEKYPNLTGWQKFQPHVYFNGGRIVSYTILGGLVGLLGSFLTISPFVTGVITIAASALMIIIGVQLLHVIPWLNTIHLKMPKFIAHKVYDASHQEAPSRTASFLFGGATFFLPCGFTQALQLYVLGTGDMITGALTMLVFSLGTLPSLAGIGAFSSFAKKSVQRHFMTFAAVLVIILGVYNIPSGLTLTEATISLPSTDTIPVQNVNLVEGKQVVEMAVNGLQYSPAQFTVRKGVPVEWRIDGRKARGCAKVLSVPTLKITEYLPVDKIKIIPFTPTEAGTIQFSCSMGMAGPGQFIVTP